ncbi:MAG: PepSY-associated TM helix domain-containing protein [Paucibacter sp.]|nr:PepSY-associated TM helix domain-containing protein [Roseateles sp.]
MKATAFVATESVPPKSPAKNRASKSSKAAFLKQVHLWHWVSSAISLVALLMFSVTGLTLNNAGLFESKARITSGQAQLPAEVLADVSAATLALAKSGVKKAELPAPLRAWLSQQWGFKTEGHMAEWSADELYLSLPRPGGDAWVRIALPDGEAEFERSDRGVVAYLNDLHKGRHTGLAWSWFLDIFSVACLLFAITGLLILKMHAVKRRSIWPLVAAGFLLPAALLLVFVH